MSNSEAGNVFVGEGGLPADPGVSVQWINRDTLEVIYEPSIQIRRYTPFWEGISIVVVRAQ